VYEINYQCSRECVRAVEKVVGVGEICGVNIASGEWSL